MARKPKTLSPQGKTVLITGASTGLGQHAALRMAGLGLHVVAGVRKAGDAEALAAAAPAGRVSSVLIDVTDQASIDLAAQVADRTGDAGLWGLVNNAGICVSAPLECVGSDLLRRQLETNVVGQLAVTRAFLPMLRRARGRLVNVTSGLGTVAIPYLGAYSAAQFAKEGMSDALRRELAPQGVTVAVVSPGAVMTPIWDKIAADGRAALAAAPAAVSGLYRGTFLNFLHFNEEGARTSGTTPGHVADAVRQALLAVRPKTRYRVGGDVRRGSLLARLLPDTAVDAMFRKIVTPVPAAEEEQHVRR